MVRFTGGGVPVKISVVRRVNIEYRLLTKEQPLTFEIDSGFSDNNTAGGWLRIYTRIWWPAGVNRLQHYSLSFWYGDSEIRSELETRRSKSSYGPDGRSVGEWRSFFVPIPRDRTPCRLVLNDGVVETVAIRIAFQSPRPWQPQPLVDLKRLTLVNGTDGRDSVSQVYWRILPDQAVTVRLRGPCRVRVRTRINYDPEMSGGQNYLLVIRDDNQELKNVSLHVNRSRTARFLEASDVVPSTERSVYFETEEGLHSLRLTLTGTLAKSGAVAVEILPKERYE